MLKPLGHVKGSVGPAKRYFVNPNTTTTTGTTAGTTTTTTTANQTKGVNVNLLGNISTALIVTVFSIFRKLFNPIKRPLCFRNRS